jgi:hypothetical protein
VVTLPKSEAHQTESELENLPKIIAHARFTDSDKEIAWSFYKTGPIGAVLRLAQIDEDLDDEDLEDEVEDSTSSDESDDDADGGSNSEGPGSSQGRRPEPNPDVDGDAAHDIDRDSAVADMDLESLKDESDEEKCDPAVIDLDGDENDWTQQLSEPEVIKIDDSDDNDDGPQFSEPGFIKIDDSSDDDDGLQSSPTGTKKGSNIIDLTEDVMIIDDDDDSDASSSLFVRSTSARTGTSSSLFVRSTPTRTRASRNDTTAPSEIIDLTIDEEQDHDASPGSRGPDSASTGTQRSLSSRETSVARSQNSEVSLPGGSLQGSRRPPPAKHDRDHSPAGGSDSDPKRPRIEIDLN